MSFLLFALRTVALAAGSFAFPSPTPRSTGSPLITLDYGTLQGFDSAGGTESFLGIPFAEPPIGQLRFNNPVPPQSFPGIINATSFGNACPQQPLLGPNETYPDNPGLEGFAPYFEELIRPGTAPASEDCLYLNVIRPAGVSSGADIPVVIWIYGGGFENGDASAYGNGTQIVTRSVNLKSPVIYVSFNYRLNAFGFLAGKEVQAAGLGNFGLHDQRLALQWVQKYIYLFGGNPNQVIVWGQSAGSISAMLQMVAYDGQLDGLFNGAVMESGSASPLHPITFPRYQDKYDFIVEQANCTSANDTLNCLRQAPYESILNAVLLSGSLLSYQSVNESWQPSVDGIFLKQSIRQSLSEGKYAQVPAILGDVDDEGTLFSLFSFNVTTDDQFLEYLRTNFLVGVAEDEINEVGELYPSNSTLGSPYDVGTNDTLTPQYKRISSFEGDFYFQVPRRYALSYLSETQNVWSYLWKRYKFVPAVGSFHTSDLQEFYDLTGNPDWVGTDALVNFAHTLNPNAPPNGYPSGAVPSLLSNISWPQYNTCSPELLTFEDPNILTFTNDTYRVEGMEFLSKLQDQMGL